MRQFEEKNKILGLVDPDSPRSSVTELPNTAAALGRNRLRPRGPGFITELLLSRFSLQPHCMHSGAHPDHMFLRQGLGGLMPLCFREACRAIQGAVNINVRN